MPQPSASPAKMMPLFVPQIARRILPKRIRIGLRSSNAVRRIAAFLFGGIAHRPFPDSSFELFFDGYRNIGFGVNLQSYEQQEQKLARKFILQLQPKVVWDIGANIGIWSLFLTAICPVDTEIRCFEPDPTNLGLLEINMSKNKIDNWIIRPIAVSNRDGLALFFADPLCGATGSLHWDRDFIGTHFGAKRNTYQVQLTTVDYEIESGARPPQFMKIDVEGHEFEVLKGAANTLRQHRPVLIFETSRNHEKISAFLKDVDYELLDVEGRHVESPAFNTLAKPKELALTL